MLPLSAYGTLLPIPPRHVRSAFGGKADLPIVSPCSQSLTLNGHRMPNGKAGRGLKSCPEQDGDDLNGGQEVDGVFFEAGCDPAGVFELVEEAFDEIALPIQDLAVASRHPAASGRRDAGSDAALAQEFAEPVGVVGFVGDEATMGRNHVEQSAGGAKIVCLAGGQDQAHWQATAVDHGIDLGRQPAARAPDRLIAVFLGAAAC